MDSVTIIGNIIRVVTPEGLTAEMPLEELLKPICPPVQDTGDILLPDGVVAVRSRGPVTVWVHQTPPRAYSFKWINPKSRAKYGPGTKYRVVKLALPYLIVLAVFVTDQAGCLQLSHANECFFRNEPLSDLDGELCYPALLNCSKFTPPEGRPLAWICTQYLDLAALMAEGDNNHRMRAGFKALLQCLLGSGFNFSSEVNEGSSWFTQSTRVDPRVATVEKWQAAGEKHPLFVLEVPWLKTGHTVAQVIERIFKNHSAACTRATSAADLARIVFNQKKKG